MRIGIKEVTNPLEVLECIVAFDVKDYGSAKRDRMLYAIILGWDDASYKSFGWSEEEIKEWKQMRERFERLKEVDFSTADVVPKSEVEQLQHKYDLAVAEREANVKGFAEELSKAKSEVDILKSLITHKEEEVYNMGYKDGKADVFEALERLNLVKLTEEYWKIKENNS